MEDMQHQVMGYDRAATMFSPDGHILQVEYAEKTIRLGPASIGIVCKDGVIIVSDKRQNDTLVINESASKIYEIDDHIMAVIAGIVSDGRVLIEKARVLAQQHRVTYDSAANTESVVKDIANVKQQFTQYGGARPFGVAMMFGGFNGKPVLLVTDVTGNYLEYKANAIGENDEKLREKLKENYRADITCKEAIKLALKIFSEVQGEKFNENKFDIGVIKEDKKLKRLSIREIERLE